MSSGIALANLKAGWRRRAGWTAGIALTVALGGGTAMGALVIAHRTDRAYPDYVVRARVSDLVINPSAFTRSMDAAIRALPGATAVHSHTLLTGSVSLLGPTELDAAAMDTDADLQVLGSVDGGYVDVDRPVVTSGRLASGEHEVFVSDDYRRDLESAVGRALRVGDTIPVAFWWSGITSDEGPPPGVVTPIGVEQLRISGFGHLADEILPDELYPRQRMIVSADVTRRYSCLVDVRPDMTTEQARATSLIPPTCSSSYTYYSLRLGRQATLSTIRTAFEQASERLTAELPPSAAGQFGYFYISQARADLDDAVHQTTQPTVAALVVFGAITALATSAVVALSVIRLLRRDEDDLSSLLAIGATGSQRARVAAAVPLAGAAIGMVGAVVVAALISPIGPLGAVRAVSPAARISLPLRVVAPMSAAAVLALTAMIGSIAGLAARRTGATRRAPAAPRRSRLWNHGSRPAVTTGVQATLGSTGTMANSAVLLGCVMTVAAITAATIFGSNLSALVSQPQRYGWPWDVAVITGGGYGNTDTAQVDATIGGDPDVAHTAFFAFDPGSLVQGHPVSAIFDVTEADRVELPIVDGRAPVRSGEAVIGTSTARDLGISIGDRITVRSTRFSSGDAGAIDVVGTAVLPSLGPFVADRAGLGTGLLVLVTGDAMSVAPAFTAIDLRDGVDPVAFVARLGEHLRPWDATGAQPLVFTSAVRPPEIVNVTDLRTAPVLLGGLLGVSLVVGLLSATAVSVRERRHELAILQALGFGSHDLYVSVSSQVVATAAAGLAAGLPLGVLAGTRALHRFAEALGVVPGASVPFTIVAGVVVGAVLIALLAAAWPARTAARLAPGAVLRTTV